MASDLIEPHVRLLWRLLGHEGAFSDLRCIDVNAGRILNRSIVQGEDAVVAWARVWNGHGNCFIGRNPRDVRGGVCRITTVTLDIDPIRPPRTAASEDDHIRALTAGRLILQRYPQGYLGSSGNGSLLVWRLTSPCDVSEDFDRQLAAFEKLCQNVVDIGGLNGIKVDSTSDNPRIIKLLGTGSVKGDRALWRISRFIDIPTSPPRMLPGIPGLPDSVGGIGPSSASSMVPNGFKDGRGQKDPLSGVGGGWARPVGLSALDDKLRCAIDALEKLAPSRRDDYGQWLNVGLALRELGPIGLQLWDSWSRKSEKYEEGICEKKWTTFNGEPRISVGSLAHWAYEDGGTEGLRDRARTGAQDAPIPAAPAIRTLADRAEEYLSRLSDPRRRDSVGIATGFPALDRLLGGCRPGEFLVVAARTGLGKTSFICTVSGGLVSAGKKVALFSTEMDWGAITDRVMAAFHGLPAKDVEAGRLGERDFQRVSDFIRGPGANFLLDDEPVAPIERVRELILRFKPDVVIYDHVQRAGMDPSNSRQQISGFVKQFKNLMRETGATGILLSQIRRLGKDEEGNFFEPTLSDIKESGTIEEEAGAVLLFHWPVEKPDGRYAQVTVNLAKNRFGPVDYFGLVFDRTATRFLERVPNDAL